ncbi:hypothetical protein L2E82_01812 [Cichorium intybus]|uniref:Uncharacterized protein n=1 Tax=Cichorium intybus TaxID=13427 RepID=A0ACB9H0Q3_CICIN|nr:hypothetical protein L2E82_01812 [Cichorium intybus]
MVLQSIASRSAAVDHHTRPSPPPVRQGIAEFVEGRRRFLYWTDYNELSKAVGSISSGLLIVEDLGGSVTSDGRSNHLHRAWVISPTWLKESFSEGRFVDEMDYIVKDDEYEVKYRINLKNTVVKARANHVAPIKDWRGTVDSSSGLCNLFF